MTQDDKRQGTTTPSAALNVLNGKAAGRCMQKHRHQACVRFLDAADAAMPGSKAVHAIVDNHATRKHPEVREQVAAHPRWSFHFTPKSASWPSAVGGFLARLTRRRSSRGVFRSISDLKGAITRFLAGTGQDPRPFTWTKKPNEILAAVKQRHQVLDSNY